MAYYLVQAAYTAEAWAAMVKDPQNREEVIRPGIERLGGSLVGTWFAFGEYDVVSIIEMPDNVSAAALSLAASTGGGGESREDHPFDDGSGGDQRDAAGGSRGIPPT